MHSVDAAYSYACVGVLWSVSVRREPYKNGLSDHEFAMPFVEQTRLGPGNHCLR